MQTHSLFGEERRPDTREWRKSSLEYSSPRGNKPQMLIYVYSGAKKDGCFRRLEFSQPPECLDEAT